MAKSQSQRAKEHIARIRRKARAYDHLAHLIRNSKHAPNAEAALTMIRNAAEEALRAVHDGEGE